MDFMILNKDFQTIAMVDTYESAIWTDRYDQYGDFEIYLPASKAAWLLFEQDYYLWTKQSDHLMIIEGKEIATDVEVGNKLIVTGRSLESILDRRIIWKQTNYSGKIQDVIRQMITECIINPSDQKRKIANFVFQDNDDHEIDDITVEIQCTGDNLYDTIVQLLTPYHIGFEIKLNDQNQFVFRLYYGVDRSYEQSTNPFVVFSPDFDNIINSNYLENSSAYKNVVLVGGEGEGDSRKMITVPTSDIATGLERREMFQDARHIRDATDQQLVQVGQMTLSENTIKKAFEGEMETVQMFVYNRDFYLGDIVQIVNEYGVESRSRVTEMIMNQSDTGYSAYPTFSVVQ